MERRKVNEDCLSEESFKNSTPFSPRMAPAVDDRVADLMKEIEENGKELLGENEVALYCTELDLYRGCLG